MKSRKRHIELCIELWTWCAKTGRPKEEWPGWIEHGSIVNECWFCEYDSSLYQRYSTSVLNYQHDLIDCFYCPLKRHFGVHCSVTPYRKWYKATTKSTRKKYAALFLLDIKQVYAEDYL